MISSSVKPDGFKLAAKKLEWTDEFIKIALSPDSEFRITSASINICEICIKPITRGDCILQQGFASFHLECFTTFLCHTGENLRPTTFKGALDHQGNILCETCIANLKECESCKNLVPPKKLHDGCCPACQVRCRTCERQVGISRAIRTNGGMYCRTCGRRELWVRPYNFNPMRLLTFQGKPKNGLFMGVELEVEGTDTPESLMDIAEDINKSFKKQAILKHDGTLNRGLGFEIVTAPGDHAFHEEFWKKFYGKKYQLISGGSPRCSTHVHISKNALSPLQIARMASFFYNKNMYDVIEAIAQRSLRNEWAERYANIRMEMGIKDLVEVYGSKPYLTSRYGQGIQATDVQGFQKTILMKDITFNRYSAFNLINDHTVELRIFKGADTYEQMMKNLEFCRSLVGFTRTANSSMREVASWETYKAYILCYRSLFPNLIQHFESVGLLPKRPARKTPQKERVIASA